MLGLIVEGHGEVAALPVLVRRIAHEVIGTHVSVAQPLRLLRGKLAKEHELKRAVELVARKTAPRGPILVLLDADEDCPKEVGPRLLPWAREQRRDREIAVVVAKIELESWFLAAIESLDGSRGLHVSGEERPAPETIRNAKGWLSKRMTRGYSETVDQPAFAAILDLEQARRAPSFDKLVRDTRRLLLSRTAPA